MSFSSFPAPGTNANNLLPGPGMNFMEKMLCCYPTIQMHCGGKQLQRNHRKRKESREESAEEIMGKGIVVKKQKKRNR